MYKIGFLKDLKHNIYFKLAIILVLISLLLVPTTMLKELIHERENVQTSAIKEVSAKWGNGQTIIGPYISVPYVKYAQNNVPDSTKRMITAKGSLNILPDELNINGEVSPEKRYRGIYEVVVYESDFTINGNFNDFDFNELDLEIENILFDKATINMGISDLKGIDKQIRLNWDGEEILFDPGTKTTDIATTGINAPISINTNDSMNFPFSLNINLKGSQHLYFVPLGKTTDVNLSSNWATPSFTGTYLPDERVINNDGFTANWNILHLNRNYPQSWIGDKYKVLNSAFGADLLLPVDNYKKSYRVVRYSILFLALTFMVFFFVEVLKKIFIHPIQYLLVGIALVLFYSLLISFSEHIAFNIAYISAAALTLFLITAYATAILKSRNIGALIFGVLTVMYSFIFSIIQMEDYALLLGSIGLFLILGIVMYFSRKIDWYNIKIVGK